MNELLSVAARIFGASAVQTTGLSGRAFEQIKPWLTRITSNATAKWLPQLLVGTVQCACPLIQNGAHHGPCQHAAASSCLHCHRPVCLDHAFADANADVICYPCAARAGQVAIVPQVDHKAVEIAWARGVLGVDEKTSQDDIKTSYKAESARWHPDKKDGKEERFKAVQRAYELLKEQP
jgi:hypothetical protein